MPDHYGTKQSFEETLGIEDLGGVQALPLDNSVLFDLGGTLLELPSIFNGKILPPGQLFSLFKQGRVEPMKNDFKGMKLMDAFIQKKGEESKKNQDQEMFSLFEDGNERFSDLLQRGAPEPSISIPRQDSTENPFDNMAPLGGQDPFNGRGFR